MGVCVCVWARALILYLHLAETRTEEPLITNTSHLKIKFLLGWSNCGVNNRRSVSRHDSIEVGGALIGAPLGPLDQPADWMQPQLNTAETESSEIIAQKIEITSVSSRE